MTIDLAVLGFLAVTALLGAASGALRQVVSLVAAVLGVLAARAFSAEVGAGLAHRFSPVARPLAPALLFLGAFALASLAGAALLRGTGLARAVRGPADRGAGALLGGAKGGLLAWALLSLLALAGDLAPEALRARARESDLAALARAHNLLARLDPDAARRLRAALEAARAAERAGRLARDPESARLLADPRIRALDPEGTGALEPGASAAVLDDPEVRALVERLAGRAAGAERGR